MERRPLHTAVGADRQRLAFVEAVSSSFEFLVEAGYSKSSAKPTYVRFDQDDQFLEVFHGRSSYELGVEFGRLVTVDGEDVDQRFHISDVLSLLIPDNTFVARTATSTEQVERFTKELSHWAELALDRLTADYSGAFDRLSEKVERESDEYLDDVRAKRLRARAQAAWRKRDFASVITAYEEINVELASVQLRQAELKRLDYARQHLTDT